MSAFEVKNDRQRLRPAQTENYSTQTYEDWRELKQVMSPRYFERYSVVQMLGFVCDFKSWTPLAVIECQKRSSADDAAGKNKHGSSVLMQPESFQSTSETRWQGRAESDVEDAHASQRSKAIVVPVHFLPGCAWMDERLHREECEKKLEMAIELDREARRKKLQLEEARPAGGAFASRQMSKWFAEAEDQLRRKH